MTKLKDQIELGASWLSVPIDESHPFYRHVALHDLGYYQLMDKDPNALTLKELDRRFLRSMLITAWSMPELWQRVKWTRRAWLYYRAARAWAQIVRRELDDYVG